jgi:isoquinoline 1-oxidoreductase beta subunit
MHAMAGTVVAQVIQISINKRKLHIRRVDCAVDCGIAINPDTVTAQMEGGIMDGLAAALYGEITVKQGRVQQSNFDTYRMLRLPQTPKITVSIMEGADEPGGIGEAGVPPTAPALVNAIFAAIGKRIRSLPVVKHAIEIA